MNLFPPSIIEAIAGKIARAIGPTLQSTLAQFASESPVPKSSLPMSLRGKSKESQPNSVLSRLGDMISGKTDQGGRSQSSGSSPAKAALPPAVTAKLITQAQQKTAPQQSNQSWWKRGWNAMQSRKPSASFRAARLTTIAAKRLATAKKAVKTSNANKNSPGWHPAAHGALLAAKNAAQQKLAQATQLQAKTTLMGSIASGRVAAGLGNLASKIPLLAAKFAGPVGAAITAAGAPFALSRMNDSRIESRRELARYSGQLSAAFAKYDTKTENLKALNARDQSSSTAYLIDQQNQLRTSLRPYQSMFSDLVNDAQGFATAGLNKLIQLDEMKQDAQMALFNEIKDIIPGMGGDGKFDFQGEFNKRQAARKKQRDDDEKVQGQQFTETMAGWANSLLGDQNGLLNARWNNVTKPSLRKIR